MRVIYMIAAALLLSACGRNEERTAIPTAVAPPPASVVAPDVAPIHIPLRPTAGNSASGALMAASEGTGVRFTGTVTGLAPGSTHGMHIHANGDCSAADASSAGDHFNPLGHPHGAPDATSHVGDLGNITADAQGSAVINITRTQATLNSGQSTDIVGKAIIVHAKADDLTSQPSGESGDRIACGVIGGGSETATR